MKTLWELFIEEVRLDTGIDTPLVNFLGSVKKHEACFNRAVIKFNQLQSEQQ